MASAEENKELQCSVCLEAYTDPVYLTCNHIFCRGCITLTVMAKKKYKGYPHLECPICRTQYRSLVLQRNISLLNSLENLQLAQPHQKTSISCTYCVDSPVAAVKSCLRCETSLCDNHLSVHSKSPGHIVTDSTFSPDSKICSVHKKILEYYCVEDSACICVYCSAEEHRSHEVESLDAAAEKKKKELKNVLQKLMTEQERVEKRVQSLHERGRKVEEKTSGKAKKFSVLFSGLRGQLDDLEKIVLEEICREEAEVFDLILQTEIKSYKLSRKMRHIDGLSKMTDPLTVLQKSDIYDLCDTEGEDDEDRDTEDGETHDEQFHDGENQEVARILKKLHKLSRILTGLTERIQESDTGDSEEGNNKDKETHNEQLHDGGDWDVSGTSQTLNRDFSNRVVNEEVCRLRDAGISQYSGTHLNDSYIEDDSHCPVLPVDSESPLLEGFQAADLLLDVNTTGNDLCISHDMKVVSRSSKQDTSMNSQCSQVLNKEDFNSGKYYWEVDVGGSPDWSVGVCYPKSKRIRSDCDEIGYSRKSWCLKRCKNKYFVIHNSKRTRLDTEIVIKRVRIYLDYEAGKIIFFICDPIQHLYTFTAKFSEPLHAVFGVWTDGGSLKICDGNHDTCGRSESLHMVGD